MSIVRNIIPKHPLTRFYQVAWWLANLADLDHVQTDSETNIVMTKIIACTVIYKIHELTNRYFNSSACLSYSPDEWWIISFPLWYIFFASDVVQNSLSILWSLSYFFQSANNLSYFSCCYLIYLSLFYGWYYQREVILQNLVFIF